MVLASMWAALSHCPRRARTSSPPRPLAVLVVANLFDVSCAVMRVQQPWIFFGCLAAIAATRWPSRSRTSP